MTTYREQILTPVRAEENVTNIIQQLFNLDEEIKKLYEKKKTIMESLPQKTPLVAMLTKDGVTEYRTVIVDKPKGAYIQYKDLDLEMNAKTTKMDLKELEL